jgi:hypothetical protein
MRPIDARRQGDLEALRTHNWDGKAHWLLLNNDGKSTVTIAGQGKGESATAKIRIPRKTFDAMVRWYLRDQK